MSFLMQKLLFFDYQELHELHHQIVMKITGIIIIPITIPDASAELNVASSPTNSATLQQMEQL